jgi:hypothetical protein
VEKPFDERVTPDAKQVNKIYIFDRFALAAKRRSAAKRRRARRRFVQRIHANQAKAVKLIRR